MPSGVSLVLTDAGFCYISLNSIEFALTNKLVAFPFDSNQTRLGFSRPHPIQFH